MLSVREADCPKASGNVFSAGSESLPLAGPIFVPIPSKVHVAAYLPFGKTSFFISSCRGLANLEPVSDGQRQEAPIGVIIVKIPPNCKLFTP
jgi:hypothetical protein